MKKYSFLVLIWFFFSNHVFSEEIFLSLKKGKVNVEFLGISPDRMSINFDWSFDGARWNLIDEYNSNSSISFFDGIYKMTGEMNNNRVEIYFR